MLIATVQIVRQIVSQNSYEMLISIWIPNMYPPMFLVILERTNDNNICARSNIKLSTLISTSSTMKWTFHYSFIAIKTFLINFTIESKIYMPSLHFAVDHGVISIPKFYNRRKKWDEVWENSTWGWRFERTVPLMELDDLQRTHIHGCVMYAEWVSVYTYLL